MNYKKEIARLLGADYVSEDDIVVAEKGHGDFALPCFKYAKTLRKSPALIADELAAGLEKNGIIEKTESVAGYLNFYLDREKRINDIIAEAESGAELETVRRENKGKTVCIDYSSINIAKPFHIGHLMSTAIGGSLYRIYRFLGWKAVGINYLGDWGTQFGKLLAAYNEWGDKTKKLTLDDMLELYVRFTRESEHDASLAERGRTEFRRIENGEPDALKTYELFKRTTLEEVNKVYDRLGIKFDSYNGEAFYNDKMEPVIRELDEKGLSEISEGAKIVNLEEYGMPPCLIQRSDGATLYATRDLAAAEYRAKEYGFSKSLYVVATQQNLHFKQVFKVLELMGRPWAKDMYHIPFGMVSYEGQALSTRSGHIVFLRDVIENAVRKARDIISEKSPNLVAKDETAEIIGVGAVLFFALSTGRLKDIDFSYDRVLSFEGETAPYLQYTYARCNSILEKAEDIMPDVDFSLLKDDESYGVIEQVGNFNETVMSAAEKYEPSMIARYLIDLAQSYNRFYIANRVITEDRALSSARLKLTELVANTIEKGLGLLLIKAPKKM